MDKKLSVLLPIAWLVILVVGLVFTPAPQPVGLPVSSSHAASEVNKAVSAYHNKKNEAPSSSTAPTSKESSSLEARREEAREGYVWISDSGKKYHRNRYCSGMKNPQQVTLEEAEAEGRTPCQNCY